MFAVIKKFLPIISLSSLSIYNLRNDSITSQKSLPKCSTVFGHRQNTPSNTKQPQTSILTTTYTKSLKIKSAIIKIDGHLFDTNLINQIFDLIQHCGGDYEIQTLKSSVNKGTQLIPSSLVLKIDIDEKLFNELMDKLDTLIAIMPLADAKMTKLPYNIQLNEIYKDNDIDDDNRKHQDISKFIGLITTDDILGTTNPDNVLDYSNEINNLSYTELDKYRIIKNYYELPNELLCKLSNVFCNEMKIKNKEKSSLKMLSSCIHHLPTGNEQGIYYALDWGGSTFRVLRINFFGKNTTPDIKEKKMLIKDEYKQTKSRNELFHHLAIKLKECMVDWGDFQLYSNSDDLIKIGFTFSFPSKQIKIDHAKLIKWTKGFDIPDCAGKDICKIMQTSLDEIKLPAKIYAICNDTVGTLLSCSFDNENTQIGMILGTGTNTAYVDKENGEIINIESGGFNKLLPRTHIDKILDNESSNTTEQLFEKMVSGLYLGRIIRLVAEEIFSDFESFILSDLFEKAEHISLILNCDGDNHKINKLLKNEFNINDFSINDCKILDGLCQLIMNRSADLSVAIIFGILIKNGVFIYDDKLLKLQKNPNLTSNELNVTVGIDGSVFGKNPLYKRRMINKINQLSGNEITNAINVVESEDGSGKGAVLAVAATLDGIRIN